MRQKKIKDVEEKIKKYNSLIVENPEEYKGKWNTLFNSGKPVYAEIGCGKGQFIINKAKSMSEADFIAIEGNQSVAYRALQKTEGREWDNLKFVIGYVDDIRDYFDEGELAGIFLNFSDPWPKERHAKRRLTYGKNLRRYGEVIKKGGTLEFKTDTEGIFDFTLEQIEEQGLEVEALSRDLHHSEFACGNIMTEYEEKFSETGKNINYVRIRY